jgi:endoglucanase
MLRRFNYMVIMGIFCVNSLLAQNRTELQLNDKEYFEMPGLNVMVFQDIYPEGHQGGISIIQNGVRVATNGDILLDPIPGQWQPVAKLGQRVVDLKNNEIRMTLTFPDSSRNGKGVNPVKYPDLYFNYQLKVKPEGASIRVTVDLERPLPKDWIGRVGFVLELYPANLFGKSWYIDQKSGIFPRQANGPVQLDKQGEMQPVPYASGKRLVIAPENDAQRMVIESKNTDIQLLDGRAKYNNGWFVVRSIVPEGATVKAIDWIITPNAIAKWKYKPVVHVSQVGYCTEQQKIAVIELDAIDTVLDKASLIRISENGSTEQILTAVPKLWGKFLRYNYCQFDFSSVKHEGMYYIQYGDSRTEPFRISREVFERHVWQPVLEYFLPIQMCHMRVNEKYRVWHGVCHLDDALMAPVNTNHFDGYKQGASTYTKYKALEHVPGLNAGGWHDAGDDDLRIESQAGEAYILTLIYEAFNVRNDNTTIDQENKLVEINQPDGKPDILQQIEHGMLSVIGGYQSLGRLYRGIISPTLEQYVMMGDISNQTDNLVYNSMLKKNEHAADHSGVPDDRWVFTEENPSREFAAIAYIAAASRALKNYNAPLSEECINTAEKLWKVEREAKRYALINKIHAAIELYITTGKDEYKQFIISNEETVKTYISSLGWVIGRALPMLHDARFSASVSEAVANFEKKVKEEQQQNPFGVPYRPVIWGAGWSIQKFGVDQYFLHKGFPEIVGKEYMLNALNFVLGCHPGENTASFASGIGSRSMTTAYGYNRADWSYIPGGVVSGTALIRPDFPELKDFPFLWQQAEYVMGGGSSNFMFLVLAANELLTK